MITPPVLTFFRKNGAAASTGALQKAETRGVAVLPLCLFVAMLCVSLSAQATLTASGGSCTNETVADNFDAVSYSQNDGSNNWVGAWQEINESDGAVTGFVKVNDGLCSSGNCLRIGVPVGEPANSFTDVGASREINLSGASTATLNFNYRVGVNSGSETVRLEVSNNGGTSWTTLQAYVVNEHTTGASAESFDLSAYIAADTQIRFIATTDHSQIAMYIDDVEVSYSVCPPSVDHLSIEHDGFAINCQAEPITLSAHTDTAHGVQSDYTGTVALSTDTANGDWSYISGGNPANLTNNGNGSGSYVFDGTESGQVVLGLLNPFDETININASDGTVSETSNSADASDDAELDYNVGGFRFYADGNPNTIIGTQIAGKESNIAPGVQILTLQSIITDSDTGACEAGLNDAHNVEMAYQCEDPATCQAGNRVTIDNSENIAGNPASSVSSYTNVSLDFGNDGIATFTFDYTDAGQIQLHAKADTTTPVVSLAGASDEFVVRPFGFYIEADGNLKAADADGTKYKRAGEAFDLTLTAVAWQSADDTDNDGFPDTTADLSDNAVTPNFGAEATPETAQVTHALVEPSAGMLGSITDSSFSSFSSGTKTNSSTSWSEVGIISLSATLTDNDYLGSAEDVIGAEPFVGRFYPDHFTLTSSTLNNRSELICAPASTFTYMDETFSDTFALEARNVGDVITQNYHNDFTYLDTYAELNVGAVNSGVDLSTRLMEEAGTSIVTTNGVIEVTLNWSVTRASNPDGPFAAFSIGIAPDDGDTQLNAFDLDVDGDMTDEHGLLVNTDIRYGRLTVSNAYGSENEDLAVPLVIQHFDGANFVTNVDDNCTTYIDNNLTLDHTAYPSDELADGETVITQPSMEIDFLFGLSQALTPVLLSAPGTGNVGQVDVTFDAPAYLEFDWEGTGDTGPQGQASFGYFRGNDRIIQWREVFN